MADDILGHENLDHGKHLKHHAHKPLPGERFGRGSRPVHVALHRRAQRHGMHAAQGGHASAHHDARGHASAGHEAAGIGFGWRTWVIGLAIIIPITLFFATTYPALAAIILVLALNTGVEYHKYFTLNAPVDFEILYLGAAYLTSVHNFWWGFSLALVGPVVAEASRGQFKVQTSLVKFLGLLITVAAASILNPNVPELIFAVILGNIAQYLVLLAMGRTNGTMSVVQQLTTIAFNAYIIAFILPLFVTFVKVA